MSINWPYLHRQHNQEMLWLLALLLHRLLSTTHALPAWQGTRLKYFLLLLQVKVLSASYQCSSLNHKQTDHRLMHLVSIPQRNALFNKHFGYCAFTHACRVIADRLFRSSSFKQITNGVPMLPVNPSLYTDALHFLVLDTLSDMRPLHVTDR